MQRFVMEQLLVYMVKLYVLCNMQCVFVAGLPVLYDLCGCLLRVTSLQLSL